MKCDLSGNNRSATNLASGCKSSFLWAVPVIARMILLLPQPNATIFTMAVPRRDCSESFDREVGPQNSDSRSESDRGISLLIGLCRSALFLIISICPRVAPVDAKCNSAQLMSRLMHVSGAVIIENRSI